MKKESGITLVALVITIIILIILAGISINTLVGENGIITKAKEAKQNIILAGEAEALQLNQLYYELETGGQLTEDEESAKKDEIITLLQKQVEELQNQVKNLTTENEELKQQIEDLTNQIGELQTELESLRDQISQKDIEIEDLKTQVNEKEEKIQELQNQLDSLNSLLFQTNATAAQILSGYKAYSGGKLLTGTMVNRGAVTSSLDAGSSYTIPAGYHNGSGKITANSLASQTSATATAGSILSGKTAWVNGTKITGTMTNRGAVTSSLNAGGSYTIPAGYHNGSGKVTANSLASQTSATATASDILSGKTAWVNGTKLTGTNQGYDAGYNAGVSAQKTATTVYKVYYGLTASGLSFNCNTGDLFIVECASSSNGASPTSYSGAQLISSFYSQVTTAAVYTTAHWVFKATTSTFNFTYSGSHETSVYRIAF